MSTLKEQIEARKQEAKDKGFEGKAWTIVCALAAPSSGPHRRTERGITTETDGGRFEEGPWRIERFALSEYDSDGGGGGSSECKVAYRDQVVFKAKNGEIEGFIPGPWEKAFEALHARALAQVKLDDAAAAAKRETDRQAAEDVELERARKDFGL